MPNYLEGMEPREVSRNEWCNIVNGLKPMRVIAWVVGLSPFGCLLFLWIAHNWREWLAGLGAG